MAMMTWDDNRGMTTTKDTTMMRDTMMTRDTIMITTRVVLYMPKKKYAFIFDYLNLLAV